MVPADELARGSSPARGKTRGGVRPAYVFASAAPASERGAVSVEAAERGAAPARGRRPDARARRRRPTRRGSVRGAVKRQNVTEVVPDVHERVRVRVRVRRRFSFRRRNRRNRRNRFGFSVSRRRFLARGDKLLRRVVRRRSTPRTGARLFVVSNVAASRVFVCHFVRGVCIHAIVVVRVVRVVVLRRFVERRIRRRDGRRFGSSRRRRFSAPARRRRGRVLAASLGG